ncbi:sigma-70 family RNA polymerase sigma factor [Aureibacillus halotolerans]|uniref:RNA polymerase sigma-70 factor (ECF subfamily) n=1 Tax=Aureibacillus halotolerans TaxID=1508390 RepID=A0A4V3D4L7_9BACI|nr:sigma-70 family RNA polymerase sigma factor [Aureibacillus halotolerans]TDQ36757.1 RNA polymerase sigma-70 factor (ECF subfamily) [Aureibacillus halotolerans]
MSVNAVAEDDEKYLKLYEDVLSYSRCFVSDQWDREDVAQDAMAKIMEYYSEAELSPALVKKIARNYWIDCVRKRSKETLMAMDEHDACRPPSESLHTVDYLLRRLTPKQAAVFFLKEGFQYRLKDIASALQLSETAVKGALFRARTNLQEDDKEEEPFDTSEETEWKHLRKVMTTAIEQNDASLFIEAIPQLPSLQPLSMSMSMAA